MYALRVWMMLAQRYLVAKSASIGRVSFMSHHQVTGHTEDSVDESSLCWFISVWILSVVLLTVVCVLASTAMSSTANRSSRAESFGPFYEQISKEIQKNIKHYKGKCKQVNFLLKLNGKNRMSLYFLTSVVAINYTTHLVSFWEVIPDSVLDGLCEGGVLFINCEVVLEFI